MIRLATYDCDICGRACTVTEEEDVHSMPPQACPFGLVPMWVERRSG